MEEQLTFRTKTGNWLNENLVQWVVFIAFILLTIWIDNLAYFFGITYVLLLLWAKKWDWKLIGLLRPKSWEKLWLKAFIVSILLIILVDVVLTPILELYIGTQPDISSLDGIRGNFINYIVFILFMWIIAAFGEEFVYRGLLVQRLGKLIGDKKFSYWIAVFISSLLFGLAHKYQGLSGIINTGIAGFVFGIIYMNSKNKLWLTILTHGVYDTILITFIYFDMDHEIFNFLKNFIN